MPGTARRVPSSRTKVFHAAMTGRGSDVESTVSSMSLTTPKRWVVDTTITSAWASSACGVESRTWCRPGGSPWPLTVRSMSPLASVVVSTVRSPIVTATGTCMAGEETKSRHHRVALSRSRMASPARGDRPASSVPLRPSRSMTTRPSTRRVMVEP